MPFSLPQPGIFPGWTSTRHLTESSTLVDFCRISMLRPQSTIMIEQSHILSNCVTTRIRCTTRIYSLQPAFCVSTKKWTVCHSEGSLLQRVHANPDCKPLFVKTL